MMSNPHNEDHGKLTSSNLKDFNQDSNRNPALNNYQNESSPREVIQMERGGINSGINQNVKNRNYGATNRNPTRMVSNESPLEDGFISNIQPI